MADSTSSSRSPSRAAWWTACTDARRWAATSSTASSKIRAAVATSAGVAYRGVRTALESEFEARLEHLAGAAQITGADVREIRLLGEEANAALNALKHDAIRGAAVLEIGR